MGRIDKHREWYTIRVSLILTSKTELRYNMYLFHKLVTKVDKNFIELTVK